MATTDKPAEKTNDWKKKELGCLWRRESSKGEKYLTGVINLKNLGFDKDVQVVCFSNKDKDKDTHPDIRIYVSEKRPAAAAPTPKTAVKTAPPAPTPPAPDSNELL